MNHKTHHPNHADLSGPTYGLLTPTLANDHHHSGLVIETFRTRGNVSRPTARALLQLP